MDGIRATLDLGGPSSISPDSTVEFILQYANRNDDLTHCLQTITISPTWDLSQEQTHDIDHSVPEGTKQRVLATPVETPPGLGGRHGIYVSYEVEAVTEDGDIHSESRRGVDPLTVPVTGARQFRAVACSASDGVLSGPVRRVIEQWGFDICAAEDVRGVKNRFTEFDNSPTLFVGVVPTSGDDEQGRQQVSNAAWVANESATLSIIFADKEVSLPKLPPETTVFQCQLADQYKLMRVTGPELLVERRALETGQSSLLNDVIDRGVKEAKRQPKKILEALAYSTLLQAAGATPQAVIDSLEVPDELWNENQPVQSREANPWPMRGANIGNTSHQPEQSGPTDGITVQWAAEIATYHTSPVIVNGTVYIGSTDNTIYALDAATGEKNWNTEVGHRVVSSVAVFDDTVYAASLDKNVYALDANTGKRRWISDIGAEVRHASPVVADGTVYLPGVTGVDDAETYADLGGTVYALDTTVGRKRWSFDTENPVDYSPAVADDTVYFLGERNCSLLALDAVTGNKKWAWSHPLLLPLGGSPAVAGGTVHIGYKDGLFAVDTAGEQCWRADLESPVRASPAVANDTVYTRDINNLYALDVADGTRQWSLEMGDSVGLPVVVDGVVYVSCDSYLYALDATDGTQQWKFTDGSAFWTPAVVNNTVYVASDNGKFYALSES